MSLAVVLAIAALVASGNDASQMPNPPRNAREAVRVVRYGDDRLSGITAVDVVVGEMLANACGLSAVTLQATAISALRAAGIKASASEKASSWFYTVYVTAESSAADGHCVTAVGAELVAQVDGIPEADRYAPQDTWGSLLVGQMPLVRQGGLVSSRRAGHAERVASALAERVSAIGARIRAVNQPKLRR